MTHTPTPWFIAGEAPANLFGDPTGSEIVNAQGYAIAETHCTAILNGWHLKPNAQHWGIDEGAHIDLPEGEAEANARRIVACVNALSGISTEAIEAGAVAELIEALRKAVNRQGFSYEELVDARNALAKFAEVKP